jgi:hypothetical protein
MGEGAETKRRGRRSQPFDERETIGFSLRRAFPVTAGDGFAELLDELDRADGPVPDPPDPD